MSKSQALVNGTHCTGMRCHVHACVLLNVFLNLIFKMAPKVLSLVDSSVEVIIIKLL